MTTTKLKETWDLWEASALDDKAKSWQDGDVAEKNEHLPPEPDKKVKAYEKPPVTVTNKGNPKDWQTSEWDTLELKTDFVPGTDKDKDDMQLQQIQDKLHKLEEELMQLQLEDIGIDDMEEGMITPDMGSSLPGRSLFTGAAMQPPNGYGPNMVPGEPAPEEIPPGYQRNTVPSELAPEEGSGFQDQDHSGTLIAPKQFLPREGLTASESRPLKEGVRRRLAEHISRMEHARRAKLRNY